MITREVLEETKELFTSDGYKALMNDDRAIYANMEPELFEVMQEVQLGLTMSGLPEIHARFWATGALFATVAFLKQRLRDSNKGLDEIAAEINSESREAEKKQRRQQWIVLTALFVFLVTGFLLLLW